MLYHLPNHLWSHIISEYLPSIQELNSRFKKKKTVSIINHIFELKYLIDFDLIFCDHIFKNRQYGRDDIIDYLFYIRNRKQLSLPYSIS